MTIWLLILKILIPNRNNKLSFKGVFNVSIHDIKYNPTKSSNRVSTDRTDNNKDYLYSFLNDVDGYIEENDRIKYSVFASTEKNQEALKITKHFGKKLKGRLKCLNNWIQKRLHKN